MKYKSSVLDFSDSCIRQRRWLCLEPHPSIPHHITACRSLPARARSDSEGPGVNLTHLWFETSDLKCFTELWSHNAPIPANKCFSQRPITERRGAWCEAGLRAGKTLVVSAFYGLLSARMLWSDARYDPERRDTVTNMNSWWVSPLTTHHSQPRPDRKPGWGW